MSEKNLPRTAERDFTAEEIPEVTEYAPIAIPGEHAESVGAFVKGKKGEEWDALLQKEKSTARKRLGKAVTLGVGLAATVGGVIAKFTNNESPREVTNSSHERVQGEYEKAIVGLELYDRPEFILKDSAKAYTLSFRVRVADGGGELMYDVEIPTMSDDLAELREQAKNVSATKAGDELNPVITGSITSGKEYPRTIDFVIAGTRDNKGRPVVTQTVKVKHGESVTVIDSNKRLIGQDHYEPKG